MADDEIDFYQSLPVLNDFAAAVRAENYRPLPDDWVVGFSDVVGSTKAIAEGRYKAVNMVGAGVIAAVSNALDRRPFPFVFGGDGASFAVARPHAAAAAKALAAMAAFSRAEFDIDLRVAMSRSARSAPRPGRPGRALRRLAALRPMRCSRAAASPGSRSGSSAATMRSRRRRPTRVPICRACPAAGASRRRSTASCSR